MWWPRWRAERLLAGCTLALAAAAALAQAPRQAPQWVTLSVPDMNCALCPVTLRRALRDAPGVIEVRADLPARRVEVRFDPAQTDPGPIIRRIIDAGFSARPVGTR